jgi:hypothetical protein
MREPSAEGLKPWWSSRPRPRLGPTGGCGAGGLRPDGASDRPMAVDNEVGRPMEASSLLPKPPAAAAGLALEGVGAGGEEGGGSVPAPSSASWNSSSPSTPAMAAAVAGDGDGEQEEAARTKTLGLLGSAKPS